MKNLSIIFCLLITSNQVFAQWQGTNPVYFNSGNVGIGTTTPGAKLGFTNVDASSLADGITWYNPTPLDYGIYRTPGAWSGPNFQQLKFSFETGIILNPGSLYGKSFVDIQGAGLRVSSGNVGIGITGPTDKLHMDGDIRLRGSSRKLIVGTEGSIQDYLLLQDVGGGSPAVQWVQDGSAKFTIEGTTGNVGIGTTTPYQWSKLHVKAPGTNPWGIMAEANSNDKVVALGHDGTSGVISVSYLSSAGWSPLLFRTQNVTRMTIGVDGNIGIGTASPIEKLTVNGTIYGKEVKVDLSVPGPDYVFDEDYKLTPLEDIKTYIDKNKHLPEVPSAKEMEKDGIQLGEMNMLLLKKIEELTLYLIQQEKKMEKMQFEIQTLKNSK